MRMRHTLIAAALAASLGGVVVPALAGPPTMPGQNMDMNRMGHGMPSGMMSSDEMSGCMGMMRSMDNGGGPPNSKWRRRPPTERSMPN